jgi:hypothetical protein
MRTGQWACKVEMLAKWDFCCKIQVIVYNIMEACLGVKMIGQTISYYKILEKSELFSIFSHKLDLYYYSK